ncbi:MAG: DMT family transporter [Intrasporangium sp.]|uniref:DMT family transporter n=1 Tax=Intrasporangium sp. TaxID=1925024 RepID=UPI003F7D1EE7
MGPLFCLLSAVGFGLMAVFAKLAYAAGATVGELLVVRFGLAGLILVSIAVAAGAFRALSRRAILAGLGMGAFGYAAQSGLYLAAVSRTEASRVALVFCVYPVLVMITAIFIGRERASTRRLIALVMALAGIVFVLGGAGGFDVVGAVLAFGSAVVYCGYILIGDRVVGDVRPVPLTALVCVGAFASCAAVTVFGQGPSLNLAPSAWGWLAAVALVSTVAAILLFFAGMARVGPTVASLLSIIEPVVTIVGAAIVFREPLAVTQALGGVMVLGAVALIQWPTRRRKPSPMTAAPVAGGAGPVLEATQA